MTQIQIRDHRDPHLRIDTVFIKDGYAAMLTVYGLGVYAVLASFVGNTTQSAWPSYQTIAGLLGCSRRQVIRKIGELKTLNIISIETQYNDAGAQTTNLITLLNKSEWKSPDILKDKAVTPSVTHSHPTGDSQSPKLTPIELTSNTTKVAGKKQPASPTQNIPKTRQSSNGRTPPSLAKKQGPKESPKKRGPRTRVMDHFLKKTALKFPTHKPEISFWWQKLNILYTLADKDLAKAVKLIDDTITELDADELTISGPNSLVKTARAIIAKRERKPERRLSAK